MQTESVRTFEQDPAEALFYSVEFLSYCVREREENKGYSINTRVRPPKSTGLQYSSSGGFSGHGEPRWPETAGGTVKDGSITWTAESVSDSSLARTLQSAAWSADTGITVGSTSVAGTLASAKISGGTIGQSYLIRCDGTFSDGTTKSGTFMVRIVRPRTVNA